MVMPRFFSSTSTFLAGKPVYTVSAYTGQGIAELREKLAELVRQASQHGQIDAAGPGQHVLDKFLVAGHVHDARLGAVGEDFSAIARRLGEVFW